MVSGSALQLETCYGIVALSYLLSAKTYLFAKLAASSVAAGPCSNIATGAKRKVISFVKDCIVNMDQFETFVKLNVLPLGSYDNWHGLVRTA